MKLKRKTVMQLNTAVFGVVALAHGLRSLMGIDLFFGSTLVPLWGSLVAIAIAAYLAVQNYLHW